MTHHVIEFDALCKSCDGTGIYVGMAERDGAGIVCYVCQGTGCHKQRVEYDDFDGKRRRDDVKRVYKTNPGIVIGAGNGFTLEEFGGMPYQEWLDGRPFLRGMENRKYTCPRWWFQCADHNLMLDWDECGFGRFSDCPHFPEKHLCWERWEREIGK